MKRAYLVATAALVLILLMILPWGCGESGELTKVRLNEVTHSVFYAPLYVAMDLGYFEEEGLELEVTTGQGADKVMTALLSGQADIAFMGPEATIYVYNEGQEDYAVSFAQLTQCDGSFLVAREPDPDFTWDKVRGATIIGGRPGGMPLMTLEYVLKKNGIIPGEDVEVLTYPVRPDAGAYRRRHVTLFEPVAPPWRWRSPCSWWPLWVKTAPGPTRSLRPKSYMESNPELIQSLLMPFTAPKSGCRNTAPAKLRQP